MTLHEILKGESKNVEFKVELPKKSEKYVKTVIAFSNTSGGRIVIGVDDETRDIIGVDEKSVFQIMDNIANAVSDSCEPQIIPDITFQTIDGKCVGYDVTDEAIRNLCSAIKAYMLQSAGSEEEKKSVHDVTKEQLLNWKILKKKESPHCCASGDGVDGEVLATNAFVLLTSNYFRFAKIQCALFKGTDRDIFIDKKEYSGALYEQIEFAYQFVLRHINLGAEIEGLIRRDSYELPVGAIREMIINAVCHRNYMDESCVQVAIYDDRVEVTSPGMLYGGLMLEEAMSGRSKIRNRAIAEVFSRMELIEEWGTGIRRIFNRAEKYGLPEPQFIEIGDTFRVNLYKKRTKSR